MTTTTFSPDREAFRQMLATLADKTRVKMPALNGRVEKALKLALAGDVELHDDGSATVYSSSDPTRRYEIIERTCTCRDYEQAPEHLCQHRLSAGLVRRTYALLPQVPAPDHDDPGKLETPLYEAPASINLKVLIAGHETQITLRDSSEAQLLDRLHTLLTRSDIRPIPSKPVSTQRGNWKPRGR